MDKLSFAATFDAAADYLEHHGWVSGRIGVNGGPRCGMGALHSVLGIPDYAAPQSPGIAAFHQLSECFANLTGVEIPCYNDGYCASGADMVIQFRDISELLRLECSREAEEYAAWLSVQQRAAVDKDMWNLGMGLFNAVSFAQYDADAEELADHAIALEKMGRAEEALVVVHPAR